MSRGARLSRVARNLIQNDKARRGKPGGLHHPGRAGRPCRGSGEGRDSASRVSALRIAVEGLSQGDHERDLNGSSEGEESKSSEEGH